MCSPSSTIHKHSQLAPNTLSIPVFLGLLDKCNPLLLVVVSHGLSYLLSISTRILSFLTKAPQHPLKFSASCWYSINTGWTFQNVSISPNDTWKTGEIPYQLPFQEHVIRSTPVWQNFHAFTVSANLIPTVLRLNQVWLPKYSYQNNFTIGT